MMKIIMQNYCLAISLTRVLASTDDRRMPSVPEDKVFVDSLERTWPRLENGKPIEYETWRIGERIAVYSDFADKFMWGTVRSFPGKPRLVEISCPWNGRIHKINRCIEELGRSYIIKDFKDGLPHKVPPSINYHPIDSYTGEPRQKTFYDGYWTKRAKTYTITEKIEVKVNGEWITGAVWDFPEDNDKMTVIYRGEKGEMVQSDIQMTNTDNSNQLRRTNKAKTIITKYYPDDRLGTDFETWYIGEKIKYSIHMSGELKEIDARVTGFPEHDFMITISYDTPSEMLIDRSGGYGDVDREYASRRYEGTTSENLDISNKYIKRIAPEPDRSLCQKFITKERLEHDMEGVFRPIFTKVIEELDYRKLVKEIFKQLYEEAILKNIPCEGREDWLRKQLSVIEASAISDKEGLFISEGQRSESTEKISYTTGYEPRTRRKAEELNLNELLGNEFHDKFEQLYKEAFENVPYNAWEAWLREKIEKITAAIETSIGAVKKRVQNIEAKRLFYAMQRHKYGRDDEESCSTTYESDGSTYHGTQCSSSSDSEALRKKLNKMGVDKPSNFPLIGAAVKALKPKTKGMFKNKTIVRAVGQTGTIVEHNIDNARVKIRWNEFTCEDGTKIESFLDPKWHKIGQGKFEFEEEHINLIY